MAFSIFISGANRGIGLSLVKEILSQCKPQHLFAACRNPASANELQEVAKNNSCVKIVPLDVTKDGDIVSAVDLVSGVVGEKGLNLLINNAGMFLQKEASMSEITRQMMQSHFDANATSPFIMTQKFLPLLKKASECHSDLPLGAQRSAVVNMSSIMSSIETSLATAGKGKPSAYHYRASKCALNMVTAVHASELQASGIVVTAVHPGWVRTDMGGPNGQLDVTDSARMVWAVIGKIDGESSGRLLNCEGGEVLPW